MIGKPLDKRTNVCVIQCSRWPEDTSAGSDARTLASHDTRPLCAYHCADDESKVKPRSKTQEAILRRRPAKQRHCRRRFQTPERQETLASAWPRRACNNTWNHALGASQCGHDASQNTSQPLRAQSSECTGHANSYNKDPATTKPNMLARSTIAEHTNTHASGHASN